MLDSEYAYSETMGKLVQKLAFLQKTRESIEDRMNNMESVVKLKEAKTDLKHQIEEKIYVYLNPSSEQKEV